MVLGAVLLVASSLLAPTAATAETAGQPSSTSPSQLAAIAVGSRTYVFGRSATGNKIVFRNIAPGQRWRTVPGGVLKSGPAVVRRPNGEVWVIALGTDRAFWMTKTRDLTTWSRWTSLGGRHLGAPGASSDNQYDFMHSDTVYVAGRSLSGKYRVKKWNGLRWTGWQPAGRETYTTSPAVNGDNVNVILNGRRPSGQLFTTSYQWRDSLVRDGAGPEYPWSTYRSAWVRDVDWAGMAFYRTWDNRLGRTYGQLAPTGLIGSTPAVVTRTLVDGEVNTVCAKRLGVQAASCITVRERLVNGVWSLTWSPWRNIGGSLA